MTRRPDYLQLEFNPHWERWELYIQCPGAPGEMVEVPGRANSTTEEVFVTAVEYMGWQDVVDVDAMVGVGEAVEWQCPEDRESEGGE